MSLLKSITALRNELVSQAFDVTTSEITDVALATVVYKLNQCIANTYIPVSGAVNSEYFHETHLGTEVTDTLRDNMTKLYE